MLEFINEPVSVEVRPRQDGSLMPYAFVWRGRRLQVESWGRESNETLDDGRAVQTYLVQTSGQETWQLCLDAGAARWTLARHWASGYQVV
jgi:hypothetical protein